MTLPLLIVSRIITTLPQVIIQLLKVSPTARLVAIEGVTRAFVQSGKSNLASLPKPKSLSSATIVQYAEARAKTELRTQKFFNETPWSSSPILQRALRSRIRPRVVVAATLLQLGATYGLSYFNGTESDNVAEIDMDVGLDVCIAGKDVLSSAKDLLSPIVTEVKPYPLIDWFQGIRLELMDMIGRVFTNLMIIVYGSLRRSLRNKRHTNDLHDPANILFHG